MSDHSPGRSAHVALVLQVKPRPATGALTGHRLQVSLSQHQIRLAGNLDLELVLRTEQHPVTELDRAHVLPDAGDLAPDQTFGNLRGRRNQDPGPGLTF